MGLALWLVHHVLEFCYPSTCALCQRVDADGGLCATCESQLDQLARRPQCEGCAKPLGGWDEPCPYCKSRGVYPFKRLASLGVHQEPLQPLIHVMKYQRRWTLAERLAARLARLDRVRRIIDSADVLVPVPLWRWRQVARGYNQSAVLARALARQFKPRTVAECLVRIRNTPSQVDLKSRQKRAENVKDAFRLKSAAAVRGKRVCVVDDVTTTGATLQEVGRTLLAGDPRELNAIVLAVADPRGRGFERI